MTAYRRIGGLSAVLSDVAFAKSEALAGGGCRLSECYKRRMRKEQEDLVLLADNPKGMRTTVVRPPDFYGPDSELSYVRTIFDAALKGGTADVIGPIDRPHEFIFVPDLAETLIALSEKEEAYGTAWNVAGPRLITIRQFTEQAALDLTPRR